MNFIRENFFKLIMLAFIFITGFIIILSMNNFLESNTDNNLVQIQSAIDDTLIQIYALEGAYPTDIYYLEDYGIIINDEKYVYDYDFIGYNVKPTVNIVEKADIE